MPRLTDSSLKWSWDLLRRWMYVLRTVERRNAMQHQHDDGMRRAKRLAFLPFLSVTSSLSPWRMRWWACHAKCTALCSLSIKICHNLFFFPHALILFKRFFYLPAEKYNASIIVGIYKEEMFLSVETKEVPPFLTCAVFLMLSVLKIRSSCVASILVSEEQICSSFD